MESFIYAPATPLLKSALSIIRLSGQGVFAALGKCFSSSIGNIEKREIKLGNIVDGDRTIDQVILLIYKGPRSYTGEDMAEIICHGSPLIVTEICELLSSLGGRMAGPGEFSALAYYNGKMDLVQAEAVNDLINAETEASRSLAMAGLKGEASALIKPLRDKVAEALSLLEVGIDFPEYEEVAKADVEQIASIAKEASEEIARLIKEGHEGSYVHNGVKVALLGAPNVGKSSLLNAILGKNKAIVSATPGTTRDIVEGETVYAGIMYRFLDTAGIREGEGEIEKEGIKKSFEAAEEADVLVYVSDASDKTPHPLPQESGKEVIEVYNKSDLLDEEVPGRLYVSALNNDVEPLLKEIAKRLGLSEKTLSNPSLVSARDLSYLRKAREALLDAIKAIENGLAADLVSGHLLRAYNNLRELLGEGATLDLTDEIFSRFCVGK